MNTRNMSLLDVPHRTLELQTNLRKDFTITEKAPARAFFLLESAISTFTFQTLLRHYADAKVVRDILALA